MRVLAISSAYGGAECALVEDRQALETLTIAQEFGLAAALPAGLARLLQHAERGPEAVAVVVGPGSFTGLRAGLSVAQGIAFGLGIPVVGVTVAEALAASLPALDGRALWCAVHARAGRVFIDTGSGFAGFAQGDWPPVAGRIAVAGNEAIAVAGALAAKGADVMLTSGRAPQPVFVAQVGLARLAGDLAPLAVAPLYVDAPEARLPQNQRGAPQ